ncbi:MAG: hypothetical protein Q9222_001209 [Ikaeria aurantiellina]
MHALRSKDADDRYSDSLRQMQAPDHRDRQDQYPEISENVDVSNGNSDSYDAETSSFHRWMPCFVDRRALEDEERDVCYQEQCPDDGYTVDCPPKTTVDSKDPVK